MDLLSKNKSLSGIYLIQNTLDSKVYVGSSIDIERRWCDHKNLLSRSKHHSKHLQNA
ncbi:GIY-YIG nuclease family protein [Kamptonema animale]|uniref:GIY-YIG nuclease family protein n=1 Tax=Kamptonema animale TaxID=92934 RepID=UPI003A941A18